MLRPLSFASALVLGLATAHASAKPFEVRRVSDDAVVLTGELSAVPAASSTDAPAELADFSALTEPGEYYLDVPSVGKSVSFRVGDDVYDAELQTVMLGFYGWRSAVDVSFDYGGVHYGHAAGHANDGWLDYVEGQVGVRQDGTGGWYDAGDYGKYLPTAAESVGNMLAAWELFSDRLDKLNLPFLPEHGSGLPDFLSELKWELDWMLKMQYADGSGRIHHKLNSPNFPGFVLPAADTSKRYFSNYSTAATAEFVAALAKAARAFAPYDAITGGYSQTLLEAAQRSYAYLVAHTEDVRYDDSVLAAGAYQKTGADDRIWAAAEMWETTGDPIALADLEERIRTGISFIANPDWDNLTTFGLVTYLMSARDGKAPAIVAKLSQGLGTVTKSLTSQTKTSSYGRDFASYYWGSNGVIARTCLLLQTAYRVLSPDPELLDACAAQIGYLYGRNQYNRSQVTGSGIAPPLHPHARISGSDAVETPYPGLLVGGGQNASNWQDLQSSFQTNEVAINWNAALVYALAGFVSDRGVSAAPRGAVTPEACRVRLNSIGYVPERSKVATVVTDCDLPDESFQCVKQEQTLSGDTSGAPSLIDDFEDGDLRVLPKQGRVGGWYAYDDMTPGTRTGAELKSAGRAGSKNALCISGQGFTGWGGGIGFSFVEDGSSRKPYDASAYTGITFWARGSATQFRAMLVDKYSDPAASLCTSCYDHFQAAFTPSSEWKRYTFSWKQLKQLGFGEAKPNVCAADLYALQFQWSGSQPFELCLDDVAFTQAAGSEEETPGGVSPRGGGCGCRLPAPNTGTPAAGVALLAVALTTALRRRRRVREP